MDIISAYREAGTYRGAAAISVTTPKTVKRVISGTSPVVELRFGSRGRATSTASPSWWPTGSRRPRGKITPKRLLTSAQAAGYDGSERNFRRLVAQQKALWRKNNLFGRRPAVWSPGEHLVIDWGADVSVVDAVILAGAVETERYEIAV